MNQGELPENTTVQYMYPHPSYGLGKVIAMIIPEGSDIVLSAAPGFTHEEARLVAIFRYWKNKRP